MMFFRCPDSPADHIVAALGRSAEKLNETTVAVSSHQSDAHRRKLLEQGIVLRGGEET